MNWITIIYETVGSFMTLAEETYVDKHQKYLTSRRLTPIHVEAYKGQNEVDIYIPPT